MADEPVLPPARMGASAGPSDVEAEPLVEVQVTCGSATEAEAIAAMLVESRLAACCWITPLRSVYRWRDETCRDDEVLVSAKTTGAHVDAITAAVTEMHSYDLPAIITLPLGASAAYAAWVRAEVG